MKYTTLGMTGESIPAVGLGMGKGTGNQANTAAYGSEDEKLIRTGIDMGMTFIDTAFDYGSGQAEETLGRAVADIRDRVFIATKFPPEKSSYADVISSAETSLKRLKTDRIDLFQSHWPNPKVPFEETLRAMDRLVSDGKVRYIGLSNCTIGEATEARSFLTGTRFASIQHEYNLLDRTAESALLPFCRDNGLTFLGYSSLAHRRPGNNNRRLAMLDNIAKRYSLSSSRLVLEWLTRQEGTVALTQTSNEQHLFENARTGDVTIVPEDISLISSIFAGDVTNVPAMRMRVKGDSSQRTYATLGQARENTYGLTPSPTELAAQIRAGEHLKPVKIRLNPAAGKDPRYEVIEGKLRYWAWVIACGEDVLIPSIIQEDGQ